MRFDPISEVRLRLRKSKVRDFRSRSRTSEIESGVLLVIRLTPRRSVFGLVLLAVAVVVGLAWVSVSSLRLESAQRESARQSEILNKERRALWRLDSSMLTPLGLENNRPYAHYFALHSPTALVFNESGDNANELLRVPSPLLSAEFPDWIALHVQIDPERGWESPQVIPLQLQERLNNDPLELSLTNCTSERESFLDRLRKAFPAAALIRGLETESRSDPEENPYIVPVPSVDEPGSEKPMGTVAAVEPLAEEKASLPPPPPPGGSSPAESLAWADRFSAGSVRPMVKGVDEASRKYSGLPAPALPQAFYGGQNFNGTQGASANPSAMKSQVPNPARNAGRSANPDDSTRDNEARKGVVSRAMESRGGYELQMRNTLNFTQSNGSTTVTLEQGVRERIAFGTAPELPWPGPQGGTVRGLPPEPDRATIPSDAAGESLSISSVPGVLVAGLPGGEFRFTPAQSDSPYRSANVKQDAIAFALASRKPLVVQLQIPVAGVNKPAPAIVPVSVHLGPMKPHWLRASGGELHLCLLRSARLESKTVYQGLVVDWPKLRQALKAQVEDLYPNAELEPVLNPEEGTSDRTMTALPVSFVPNAEVPVRSGEWSPLRTGLVVAWAAALISIVAVAFGGRAILAMSERRVRFASAVTHELRTPLTAMQLHLDLLNSGLVTEETKRQEYLGTIGAEADRLNRLVENVLAFAKLETKSAQANARAVSVGEILGTVRETWADRLQREGFELVTEASVADPDAVRIDPRVLEQVLGNLIDNARKYSQGAEDRRIRVRVLAGEAGMLAIEVEDRGPGIPATEMKAIFRPFQRGSSSQETGGAGLGLSLAKEWVELFGGSIRCTGANPGCRFRLELPRA
jgi:signal transduction histidine kinase